MTRAPNPRSARLYRCLRPHSPQILPSGIDGFDVEYDQHTRHDYAVKGSPGEFHTALLPHNVDKNRYDDVLASLGHSNP